MIELAGAFGIEKLRREQDILKYGWKLSKLLKANVLITRGKDGMTLFRKDNHLLHTQAIKQKIIDPCGAGDSVAAAITLSLACGMPFEDAMKIATFTAGTVIQKLGTAVCTLAELKGALK